jgi:dihydroorotate dehydrogenase
MNRLDTAEMEKGFGDIVQHVIYRLVNFLRSFCYIKISPELSIDDIEDVAIRVFEPRDLHIASNVNIAISSHPWHIIMFECDTFGL